MAVRIRGIEVVVVVVIGVVVAVVVAVEVVESSRCGGSNGGGVSCRICGNA